MYLWFKWKNNLTILYYTVLISWYKLKAEECDWKLTTCSFLIDYYFKIVSKLKLYSLCIQH